MLTFPTELSPSHALQLDVELALDIAWLNELAQGARALPSVHPLARFALDAISGNPSFKSHNGRLEARGQTEPNTLKWSLEPLSPALFPAASPSDLVLRQHSFPGTTLQLLRALPEVRIVETEGLLRWPKVVALSRATYWDKAGAGLPLALQKWWLEAQLSGAQLRFEDGRLKFSLRATWKEIEPVIGFLLSPGDGDLTVGEETAPSLTNPLQETVFRQLTEGFPALKGSQLQIRVAVAQEQANTLLSSTLAQLQAIPTGSSDLQTEETGPPFNPLKLVTACQVAFEAGRAVIGIELKV
jgi:hypothetical protein